MTDTPGGRGQENGVSVLTELPPSSERRRRTPDTSERLEVVADSTADLTRRVSALEESRRSASRAAGAALVAALGSFGAVLVWAFNAREESGYERARRQQLELDVKDLKHHVYRSSLSRDERPDPPPITAASSISKDSP